MLLLTDQCSKQNIAESAATISLYNFHWQYATLVLFNSTLICGVNIFLKSYQKNVIVGRGTFYPGFVKRVRQYVIFGTDIPDIEHMITWMQRHQFDNTGKYIVVCQSKTWNLCNELDIVKVLWNYKIINVVLINNCKEETVDGFTYYQPEDCQNVRPTNIKNWVSCLFNDRKYCQNMYPLKLKNLHRCPIIVSTFNQEPYMDIRNGTPTGIDGDLLFVIAEAMNFSLVLMTPRIGFGWGKIEDNGTWSGSLADIHNEWANFSMTSASVTLSRFTTFQMSTDYAFVSVVWISHPSKTEPPSLKLLRPFKPYVHIAVATSFIMVLLFKMFLRSNFILSLRHGPDITFPLDIVFYSWEVCMGLPLRYFPVNKALLHLEIFWIWYCFLIRTLYQVCLINSLQTEVYDPEFDTVEESIASKYTFGGGMALRDYYIDNVLVYEGWKNVESIDIDPLMVKISQGLKFVMAMNLESAKTFLSSNPDKKLHVLPRLIVMSPISIFFKKYAPLATSLNVVLSRLTESGIVNKIYLDNTGKKVLNTLRDNIPINMVHYTGCYAILLTGWLLSGLCFVAENLISQRKKK